MHASVWGNLSISLISESNHTLAFQHIAHSRPVRLYEPVIAAKRGMLWYHESKQLFVFHCSLSRPYFWHCLPLLPSPSLFASFIAACLPDFLFLRIPRPRQKLVVIFMRINSCPIPYLCLSFCHFVRSASFISNIPPCIAPLLPCSLFLFLYIAPVFQTL